MLNTGSADYHYVYMSACTEAGEAFPFQSIVKVDVQSRAVAEWKAPAGGLCSAEDDDHMVLADWQRCNCFWCEWMSQCRRRARAPDARDLLWSSKAPW